jgi:hypothetical protein
VYRLAGACGLRGAGARSNHPAMRAPPSKGGERSRRFPRLLARCRVRLRDRFGVWDAETEDLGPRGCRIIGSRAQTLGALVSLTLESERVAGALEVAGQVVWARTEKPARAGISFAGGGSAPGAPTPAAWFETMLAAEHEARREGAPAPEIVIEIEEPVLEPEALIERLSRRARDLLGAGQQAAAEVIFRRALALAPDDASLAAALRDLAAH